MIELRDITRRFGAVLANDRVSLKVDRGSIHAIVGENGAGKSTAMKIAYGLHRPDSGEIVVDGMERRIHSPHDAIALGIGMVHQHFMLVETMTVAENIILGAERTSRGTLDIGRATAEITELSQRYRLAIDPRARVEDLSVGQQQRVELLKALYREARILILDEPTAVLTPQEVEDLFATLRSMRDAGQTVVIITHKLSEVLAVSDRVTVMRDGKVVGELETAGTSAAELARLMVGRDVLLRVEKTPAAPGEVILSVRDLRVSSVDGVKLLDGVSFEVRAGEIVGIAGVEGNGQTELIESIAGLSPRATGEVALRGSSISALDVRHRRDRGIAHIPEDRHRRGLLLEMDLVENTILGSDHRAELAGSIGMMRREAALERTETIIRDYDVRPANPAAMAGALSGGNQQKLIIGREVMAAPALLLVSQPTRGVDIGAIEFIHRRLIEIRDAGCAIILVSAELEEVTALADRLFVMREGKIVAELDPTVAAVEEIGMLMTGGGGNTASPGERA